MKSNSLRKSQAAFTLTELCVVLGCVTVLAVLVLPALAGSKVNSQVIQCLENTRRLTLAWRMYAEDNSDLMVYSSDDGTGNPYISTAPARNPGNLYAWTWSKLDFNGANAFNWDTNADITIRPLWPYVKDAIAYKCPADQSEVTVAGAPVGSSYQNGMIAPRVRSYSMNYFLGGYGGNRLLSIGASWQQYFPWYSKLSELGNLRKSPGPSQTFIFVEERSDCINWGNYIQDMTGYPTPATGRPNPAPAQYEFNGDIPASYHNYAGCVSFADGHAEIHRWHDAVVLQPLVPNGYLISSRTETLGQGTVFPDSFGLDVAYMQNASARPH